MQYINTAALAPQSRSAPVSEQQNVPRASLTKQEPIQKPQHLQELRAKGKSQAKHLRALTLQETARAAALEAPALATRRAVRGSSHNQRRFFGT